MVWSHPLTNLKIQKYYQNEPKLNEVYCRDNLRNKIKDGAYVINRDEYFNIGTHSIAFYALNNNVTYFNNFDVEHIPKEIIEFIGNKNIKGSKITKNVFVMQTYDSLTYGYFCIALLILWLKAKA